jgi:ABC-type bacteriocin/lantibiotic exporter with double-glycine peptidase domain
VLRDLNLQIPSGSFAAILGPSGCGKTTLLRSIAGLITPSGGAIRFGKQLVSVSSLVLPPHKRNIGYVPQNIYLIDESIKRNIAFGIPDSDICPEKLLNALKLSQLDGFISNLDNGVETMVGDRGVKLSGGQRQRIGIARALYNNPTILILDESTNAIDEINEEKIINNLILDKELISIFLITHKKKLIKKCNEVINIKTL